MVKRKKEKSRYDQVRSILKAIDKKLDEAESAANQGKESSSVSGAIVATETLWQELRYIGQNL